MKKIILSIFICLVTILGSISPAFADINTVNQSKSGYGYEFSDDPLNAGGFGDKDLLIKVRAKAWRVTLIRPRTNFIPEMLKSVEEL